MLLLMLWLLDGGSDDFLFFCLITLFWSRFLRYPMNEFTFWTNVITCSTYLLFYFIDFTCGLPHEACR